MGAERQSRRGQTGGGGETDAGSGNLMPYFTTPAAGNQSLRDHLHRGGAYAYLWHGPSKRSDWFRVGESGPDVTGQADVYFGVHPVSAIPAGPDPTYVRGRIDVIAALNCLFAEWDGKDFDRADPRGRGLALALQHIDKIDPAPTALIHSGGGFHGYWLLASTWELLTDADRAEAAALQGRWVAYVRGDPGAKDLARVLRVPGTVNAKYPDRPVVALVDWHPDRLYTPEELAALVPEALAELLRAPSAPTARGNGSRSPQAEQIIAAGGRNAALTALAGALRRRGASVGAIAAALQAENMAKCRPPLPDDEIRKIASSVGRYEPDPGIHETDTGNAARLARLAAGRLRFVREWGWLAWDGRRWARDVGLAWQIAREVPRNIHAEASAAGDEERRKALGRWALVSESAGRTQGMLLLAESEPGLRARIDDFDTDPLLLNVANGVLDLATGALRPHDPADLITALAPCAYDPGASSPVLDRYLAGVAGHDAAFVDYLQRALGYTLTGRTDEEAFFLLLGPGGSGKTTLIEAMLGLLGDYAVKASFETFLAQERTGAPRPDLARLRGARLVAACEAEPTKRLAEVVVKEITGRDTVTARYLFHDEFSFRPVLKLWLAANAAPRVNDRDSGTWRRLRRVPFEQEIATPDPSVKAAMADPDSEAAQALLAWLVRGCLAWQREGLGTCELVSKRTAALRADMDPLGEFFAECCAFSTDAEAPAKALRAAYVAWAEAAGVRGRALVGNKEWGERLTARGCESKVRRRNGANVKLWLGVGLATDDDATETATDATDKGLFHKSSLENASRRNFGVISPPSVASVAPANGATLPDACAVSGAPGDTPSGEIDAYTVYVQACRAAGGPPLMVPEWRDAGRPGGPSDDGEWIEIAPDDPQEPGGVFRMDMATGRSYRRVGVGGFDGPTN